MILDSNLIFSGAISAAGVVTGQTVAATDSSVLSTNTVDLAPLSGNQVPDIGSGEPFGVSFSILAAPSAGTSVGFQLVQADDAALTSNLQVIGQTGAIPVANLTTGQLFRVDWPRVAPFSPKRYVGVRYVTVGAVAGLSVFAATAKDHPDKATFYKSGYTVA